MLASPWFGAVHPRGRQGVWCSRVCRGDAETTMVRKGGRPRKYRTPEECRAAKTAQQVVYRNVSAWGKTPLAAHWKQRACRCENDLLAPPPIPPRPASTPVLTEV